jgi:branched-chain amino acid transport system substrate-binding protein
MKRKLILGMTSIVSIVLAAGVMAQSPKTIKIGEINSYSTAPQFATPYRNGWQLALEEINAAGGINGRMLEVVPRDDEGKQDLAIRHAQNLIATEKVDVLAGAYMSNIGLALASEAARHKKLFVASAPLTDALTWDKGNRYTFRLRPSTYMQAAMLVDEAAKLPARRWAMLAPNYEYGQSAVASFKQLLKARRPDVEFIGEQWPALGKLDAAAVVQALQQAKPDAIFNATFGADLVNFVHEGARSGLFSKVLVVSMLTGEPENLDMLKDEIVKGWIVTGYPWDQINTPEHSRFMQAYQKKYSDYPRLGSVVGYTLIVAIAEAIKKAESTDSEKLVIAMRNLSVGSPFGPVSFRAIDQQSTMGAFIGILDQKDGKGVMSNWHYADGKQYLPDDAYVKTRRPAAAIK